MSLSKISDLIRMQNVANTRIVREKIVNFGKQYLMHLFYWKYIVKIKFMNDRVNQYLLLLRREIKETVRRNDRFQS